MGGNAQPIITGIELPELEEILASASAAEWTPEIDATLTRYYTAAARMRRVADLTRSLNTAFGRKFTSKNVSNRANALGLQGGEAKP